MFETLNAALKTLIVTSKDFSRKKKKQKKKKNLETNQEQKKKKREGRTVFAGPNLTLTL